MGCAIRFLMNDFYFTPAPAEHIKKEKTKAKELRQSSWWRQRLGEGVCYYCEQRFSKELLTMDHIVPIIRGGKSTRHNVVVACKECNSQKKYKTPAELALDALT